MAVFDTTFLIDLAQGDPQTRHRLQEIESFGPALRVPAAVWTEFMTVLSPRDRHTAARRLDLTVEFEAFTREIADVAARIQHELMREGRRLSWHDLQVVATALHYDEDLVSNDRSFGDVPGLAVQTH